MATREKTDYLQRTTIRVTARRFFHGDNESQID